MSPALRAIALALAGLLLAGSPRPMVMAASSETLATTSRALENARAGLDPRFRTYETRRFVVLSDTDSRWSVDQAERLERTHHQFLRFARRLGLEPAPLEHKLVCVLFDDREDYAAFAVTHDGVTDPWIAGYYAPASDRIVFYHADSNPSVVEARAKLDRMASDLDRLGDQARHARRGGRAEQAETLRRRGAAYREHLRREAGRVDDFAREVSMATLVHEAVHQMMFHTGVQSPRLGYPVWFSEGIATAFETDDTSAAFGPDHEYGPRRDAFERLLVAGDLIPLRELVTWSEVPSDPDTVHALYHQSYALVTWMSRFRRGELRAFLELALEEPAGEIQGNRALALFERAFGNVDKLERAWLRHENARE